MAGFNLSGERHNPDILTCLSNLSNDEVFTPPDMVNQILDKLPEELWHDPNAKFLDPACKTGVFLREIAKRLAWGLADKIPDLQERINHIFKNQLFGIAITRLTALLSRRSLYCSLEANSRYSIVPFEDENGRIHYDPLCHTWENGHCIYCGGSQDVKELNQGEGYDNYAYEFIHNEDPSKIINTINQPNEDNDMRFDVIISNPPYQIETGGAGRQAKPIYPLFVEKAMKLNPRYIAMIIPSRWYAGGMGMEGFRKMMLENKQISHLVDFINAKECFPQNSISGGVCYFLWDRNYKGTCSFYNAEDMDHPMERDLSEFPVLVRYNKAVDIIHTIRRLDEESLESLASPLCPFGLPTNMRGAEEKTKKTDIVLHSSAGVSFIPSDAVNKTNQYLSKYKVLISKTGSEHALEPSNDGNYRVISSTTKVIGPGEVCTHSYFVIGQFDKKEEASNLLKYLFTKFARFLILQSMTSINLSRNVLQFVPQQDFSKTWTDEDLYRKYKLSQENIDFIESMIKPMDDREE